MVCVIGKTSGQHQAIKFWGNQKLCTDVLIAHRVGAPNPGVVIPTCITKQNLTVLKEKYIINMQGWSQKCKVRFNIRKAMNIVHYIKQLKNHNIPQMLKNIYYKNSQQSRTRRDLFNLINQAIYQMLLNMLPKGTTLEAIFVGKHLQSSMWAGLQLCSLCILCLGKFLAYSTK